MAEAALTAGALDVTENCSAAFRIESDGLLAMFESEVIPARPRYCPSFTRS